jgi:carotenoid 1,2-hydratase
MRERRPFAFESLRDPSESDRPSSATIDAGRFRARLPGNGWRPLRTETTRSSLLALPPRSTHEIERPLSRGWLRTPRSGRTDGDALWATRRKQHSTGPGLGIGLGFDHPIAPGGYQWHYVDGVSDDAQWSIVIIALQGSPFSPAYASDRAASPLQFCAMNVALYGPHGQALFSLTEHAITASDRDSSTLAIGHSSMRWDRRGSALHINVDERSARIVGKSVPIRGSITLTPESHPGSPRVLDDWGQHRHHWWPIAPLASIEVALSEPSVNFRGHGYHDANWGDASLESAFERWSWSRARLDDGHAAIFYDTMSRGGGIERRVSLLIDRHGQSEPLDDITKQHRLPMTRWGLTRSVWSDSDSDSDFVLNDDAEKVRVVRALEDTPFYARALVRTSIRKRPVVAMHEAMSCARLSRAWVRFLINFRMRRSDQ